MKKKHYITFMAALFCMLLSACAKQSEEAFEPANGTGLQYEQEAVKEVAGESEQVMKGSSESTLLGEQSDFGTAGEKAAEPDEEIFTSTEENQNRDIQEPSEDKRKEQKEPEKSKSPQETDCSGSNSDAQENIQSSQGVNASTQEGNSNTQKENSDSSVKDSASVEASEQHTESTIESQEDKNEEHICQFVKVYWYGSASCGSQTNFYNTQCTICGKIGESGTDIIPHTPVETHTESVDGCLVYDVTESVCSVCGAFLERRTEVIGERHTWVTKRGDAVWDEVNHVFIYPEITYCSVCFLEKDAHKNQEQTE